MSYVYILEPSAVMSYEDGRLLINESSGVTRLNVELWLYNFAL